MSTLAKTRGKEVGKSAPGWWLLSQKPQACRDLALRSLAHSPSTRPPTQQLLNLRLTALLLLITVANNYCFTISDEIFLSFIFKNWPKGVETAWEVKVLATNPADLHPSLQPM